MQIPVLSLDDPIVRRQMPPPLPPVIINGEEEWVVEDILDSKLINWKLQYLVKWKDFGMEHNSWEPQENVHALDIVVDFYQKHPGAARHIWLTEFFSLSFQSTIMLRRHDSEGGGLNVRGHHSPTPTPPIIPAIPVIPTIPDSPNTSAIVPQYVPPHRRRPNYHTRSGARL